MTTVYWSEVAHEAPAETRVYWAEAEHLNSPTVVYWAEVEATADVGGAAVGSGDIPEPTIYTLTGGGVAVVGDTVDLTWAVEDQDGDPVANLTGAPSSTAPGVATVVQLAATDASGQATIRATAVAGGASNITVGLDGLTSAAQTVSVRQVTSVSVTLAAAALEVGTTGAATVTVLDQDSAPMAGMTVAWSSTNAAVIASPAAGTTDALGRASVALPALSAGTTTITATCEGVTSAGKGIAVAAVATPPGYATTGSAKVIINCVSVIKRMGKPRPRRFSDADQRKIDPADSSFSRVKDQQEREIIWPTKELMRRYL